MPGPPCRPNYALFEGIGYSLHTVCSACAKTCLAQTRRETRGPLSLGSSSAHFHICAASALSFITSSHGEESLLFKSSEYFNKVKMKQKARINDDRVLGDGIQRKGSVRSRKRHNCSHAMQSGECLRTHRRMLVEFYFCRSSSFLCALMIIASCRTRMRM